MNKSNEAIIVATTKGYYNVGGDIYFNGKKKKQNANNDGYYRFTVRVCDKTRPIMVHRFIAYTKYGNELFKEGLEVRHFDGNCKNNNPDNILLGTKSQNAMDKKPEARLASAIVATSFMKKHNHENIISMHKSGMSYTQIMAKTGIKSKGTISFIVNNSIAKASIVQLVE